MDRRKDLKIREESIDAGKRFVQIQELHHKSISHDT